MNSTCEPDDLFDGKFSESQLHSITAVTIFSSILSTVGSAFIIATYHLVYGHVGLKLYDHGRRASMRMSGSSEGLTAPASTHLLYWLSFSDLCLSVTYVIDGGTPAAERDSQNCGDAFCAFLGASQQFFGLCSILWTAGLAYNIQLTVLANSQKTAAQAASEAQSLLRLLHVVIWGSSGLVVCILAGLGAFGSAGQWCWIHSDFGWARILFLYVPLFAVLAFHAVSYWRVRQRLLFLRRAAGAGGSERRSADGAVDVFVQLSRRFRNYAIVFIVVWVMQIANRFQNIAEPHSPSYVLYMLQSLLGPLQGLGNAAVYGNTPRVREMYSRLFPRCCGWIEPVQAPAGSPDAECGPAAEPSRGVRELSCVSGGAL